MIDGTIDCMLDRMIDSVTLCFLRRIVNSAIDDALTRKIINTVDPLLGKSGKLLSSLANKSRAVILSTTSRFNLAIACTKEILSHLAHC